MINTGKITITEQGEGNYVVDVQFAGGTLWLTDYEISRLFNVHYAAISSNLRSIFKSRLLFEKDVSMQYSYTKNGKSYSTTLYNFDVLLFLAYRVDSYEVRALRKWLTEKINKSFEPESKKPVLTYIRMTALPENGILN